MIWPPPKAWTSKFSINSQVHFVAINYGGESLNRWVILMSVIDSSVVVKVAWSQLIDSSMWESGWVDNRYDRRCFLHHFLRINYYGRLIIVPCTIGSSYFKYVLC